ncbi:uncharacterized protein LOC116347564 [Contarinia nasturtii]|uniref:uncharacterized protein LOC116347564 n=1 Tax=Contarinia nasturtii TaxID=265458 RepID=UPI0012D39F12|nr:uncharacterized protein LOC116347564 [Contarinia nasturtii]
MSNRIFPNLILSRDEQQTAAETWKEVYNERGENIAIAGITQLILDLLASTCHNVIDGEFELPHAIDLKTFDLDEFMSIHTKNKIFNVNGLQENDVKLAELIILLVKESNEKEMGWLEHFQKIIRAMLRNDHASQLVANTVVCLYTHAIVLRYDTNTTAAIKNQMQQMQRFMSMGIAESNLTQPGMTAIIDAFFRQDTNYMIERDTAGCVEIVANFLRFEHVDVNGHAITKIIECGKSANGHNWLQFCTNQNIVRELTIIITSISGVKVRKLALELACNMQEPVRNRNVFTEQVLRWCVYSDNEIVQQLTAKLCRLMLRGINTDIADPSTVVIRATQLFQRFRRDYTKCPKRLVNTFFFEFTNWDAVFEAIGLRLDNTEFINELFSLLERVIDRFKMKIVLSNDAVEHIRIFIHHAIQYMNNLDRKYVRVYANIIYSIIHADILLNINPENLFKLGEIVSEIFLNFFDDFTHQMNVITVFQILVDKSYIRNDSWMTDLDQFLAERNAMQRDLQKGLQENVDFDGNQNVLNTFMKLSVFSCKKLISSQKIVTICNQSNILVMDMTNQLDLSKNRTFLAYNLIILVQSYVAVCQNHVDHDVSVQKITKRLLEILQKTQEDFDFLCMAVFWCLSEFELRFAAVSTTVDIKVLSQNMLKKISLVIDDNGVNHTQLRYIEYMLKQLKLLLYAKRDIELRDIVVKLLQRFPDHDYAFAMLQWCIGMPNILANCAIAVLRELSTKKMKQEFMQRIETIINNSSVENKSVLWVRIMRAGLNELGQDAQAGQSQQWVKKAKQSGLVLSEVTFRNLRDMNETTQEEPPAPFESTNESNVSIA